MNLEKGKIKMLIGGESPTNKRFSLTLLISHTETNDSSKLKKEIKQVKSINFLQVSLILNRYLILGNVIGQYGYHNPDGSLRIVKYAADVKGGFKVL